MVESASLALGVDKSQQHLSKMTDITERATGQEAAQGDPEMGSVNFATQVEGRMSVTAGGGDGVHIE